MSAYEPTAGVRRQRTGACSGSRAGDPIRGARAIIEATLSDKPPLHLFPGGAAHDFAQKEIGSLQSDFDAWKAVTVGADPTRGARCSAVGMSVAGGSEWSTRRCDARPRR